MNLNNNSILIIGSNKPKYGVIKTLINIKKLEEIKENIIYKITKSNQKQKPTKKAYT